MAGVILLVCVVFAIVYYTALGTPADTQSDTNSAATTTEKAGTTTQSLPSDDAVIEHVRTNISALSPQKEVLGGTFFVTKITVDNGTGTVEYEDGHNAFVADFTYTKDSSGEPVISTFVIQR